MNTKYVSFNLKNHSLLKFKLEYIKKKIVYCKIMVGIFLVNRYTSKLKEIHILVISVDKLNYIDK